MKQISIIVPVYNSEKYINGTLDSIAAQTYSDIEVIIIDDGSTDGSGAICKDKTIFDHRFHYYRIENAGPSNARNIGIKYANGAYIGFCDSDDIIDKDMYKTLVEYIESSSSDIVLCDIYSERDRRRFGFPWEDGAVFQDDQIGSILAASMVGTIHDGDKDVPQWGSVVRCLFKSEIIRCNHVAFPTDIYFAEDLVFTLRYLSIIKKAIICDQALYRYRCNTESIMNSFFSYKSEMFHERKKLISYIEDIITEFPCQEELSKRLHITARCYYRDCVGNACRPGKGRTSDEKKLELREILNDSDVKEIFKKFDTKDKRTKIIYLLIKYRLASIIYIYYYYRFKKR